jgi:hypothetical protein
MKFKLKYSVRAYFNFLRQSTPHFKGSIKHFIWGLAEKTDNQKTTIPKIIWLYWDEVNISSITVKLCVNLIKSLHKDYNIELISKSSLLNYLPDFPIELLKKPSNFVSDMIRLMLLEQHGGVYLDATVLLSKPISWALELQQTDQSEVVLYYTDENTREEKYPMVETWFIAALPQSNFIKAWREEYQKCILSLSPKNYYENNKFLPLANFPLDVTYYASYMAGQIVMRKSQQYRLSLLRAEDEAFLYGLGFKKKWDEMAMADALLFNQKTDQLPKLIKLIRFDRKCLDYYIERKFYKKNSWLGEIMHEQLSKI